MRVKKYHRKIILKRSPNKLVQGSEELYRSKQFCSLYEKPGERKKSFADILGDASSLKTQHDIDIAKKIFSKYLNGLTIKTSIVSGDNAIEIVANAAVLERFKIEALNILGGNKSLSDTEKMSDLKMFFGPGSEYAELYNQYYHEQNGCVKKAQNIIQGDSSLKGLLNDPIITANINRVSINEINNVNKTNNVNEIDNVNNMFNDFNKMKELFKASDKESTLNIYTNAFDKANIDRITVGLAMSDPRQIGFLFALIGDKTNQGEIKLQERSLGFKISVPSARLLVVIALGVSSFMMTPGPLIAFMTLAAPLGVSASMQYGAVALIYGLGALIRHQCLKDIRVKVEEERAFTKDIISTSAIINFFGTGVSTNDISNYMAAPSRKEEYYSIEKNLKNVEKPFHNMLERYQENEKIINGSMDLQNRINQYYSHLKPQSFLSKLNINVNPANQSHVSKLEKTQNMQQKL